jgi:predicted ATPase/DNA-binding SARP family transcriptional activator
MGLNLMNEGSAAAAHTPSSYRLGCLEAVGSILRFGVLGPLEIERDGEIVPLGSGRQRVLLALLLMAGGEPLSRDRLVDEVWGERPPPTAVKALHMHLSKLRRLLGGTVELGSAGYVLARGGYELDLWRFDGLVEQAVARPAHATTLLGQALAMVRGEPLGGVVCEGSLGAWRRSLEERLLQTRFSQMDARLAEGAAGELIAELETLVTANPFEERPVGQLMLALYRAGRQADALDAYERARRMFAVELGLEPGDPLSRLQQKMLERDPGLLHPIAESAPMWVAPRPRPRSNLPRYPGALVGRETELTALAGFAVDPDMRLITLTGPGGVGKTRLLLALAQRLEPDYSDGAVFVALDKLSEPAQVMEEIAAAVARRDGADRLGADALAGHLLDRELLLVVDNFEHLLEAAPKLAELIQAAPRIRAIVSSRAPLRLRGEQVFEVEPLPVPADDDQAQAAHSPAVQLFLQRALAANPRLEVDAAVTVASARICRALDGLPLAIELAASRLHALTLEEIERQLARPLLVGGGGLRDLPDRQRTLEAAITWSYDLLAAGAREVLGRVGVFRGGFNAEALDAVAGRPARAELEELVGASLVRRQPEKGRFGLLELVRAFALEQLEESGQAAEARVLHRRYFAAQAAAASDVFEQSGSPDEGAAPLWPDHANIRAAFDDAIEAEDRESSLQIAMGLRPVWYAGFLRQEAEDVIERVLDRLELGADQEIALITAACFLESPHAGDPIWHRRLEESTARCGDRETLARAICNLFGFALNRHDREEIARLEPALRTMIAPDTSTKALGWIHYNLACAAYVANDFDRACEYSSASAQESAAVGYAFMLAGAVAIRLLAGSALSGSIAACDLAEVLECARATGVQPDAVVGLWFVSRYAATLEPEAARRWLAHAERIRAELDQDFWPESVLRDETLAVLGSDDVGPPLEAGSVHDHSAALAEAATWLAARDPGEVAPRDPVLLIAPASERA